MLDRDFILLPTAFRTLRIRIGSFGAPLTAEQQRDARRAVVELRFGIEARDPVVLDVARRLQRELNLTAPLRARSVDGSVEARQSLSQLADELEAELERGRLLVEREAVQALAPPPEVIQVDDPVAPPPERESTDTFFEVRFVDETDQGIPRLDVEFTVDGKKQSVTTNGAGIALLEGVKSSFASVAVKDVDALERLLDPRWTKPRPGKPPRGTFVEREVRSSVAPADVKAVVPHAVVVKPPLGRLFVELSDKSGRFRHIGRKYAIAGPMTFSGVTDEQGRLTHEGVFPGDYRLTLTLELLEGEARQTDVYETALVVLGPTQTSPLERMLGVVPRVVMARIRGLLFDTNKSFLLPSALGSLRHVRDIYVENSPGDLLIVGHTDTTAEPAINDPLSKERAANTQAFLEDDVDAWLAMYEPGVKQAHRWGGREDRLMIRSMPDFPTRDPKEDMVRWFQRTRELGIDGKAGPETRRQLITEYMSLDGVELAADPKLDVVITTHGCGENFPLAESGEELDPTPEDAKDDQLDRRVEFFFFDREFGVVPAPAGPDGEQYLEWRRRVTDERDFEVAGFGRLATLVELHDALFRTNSAVVLPEGEAPSGAEHEALTSVGMFALILRFNAEHPGKRLFVAGHTDTTADVAFNQKLSTERAKCALALLEGNRAAFVELAEARHTVADYKQILSWASKSFTDLAVGEGGFDCDPGKIDDVAATGVAPVKAFQEQYNANKSAIGGAAADLAVDGDVGPLTWGAFFDVYEFALRRDLDEDAPTVAEMRKALIWADDDRKALGFSEHHPVDKIGRDNFRSQANRRVEIYLFDEGEEADLVLAEADPAASELYLPGEYEQVKIDATNARRGATVDLSAVRGTTRFTANVDFPKPSLLAGVRAVQAELAKNPNLGVLLIGHADDVGIDQSVAALSLERAELVKAWLTGDAARFRARFQAGGAARAWGFNELQWMLQSLTLAGKPCYTASVDGYPGPGTLRALELFQIVESLPITGLADDATLDRLAQRYVELADNPVAPNRIEVVAAGSSHPPKPFGRSKSRVFPDDAPQRLRRVEALLFTPPLNPPATDLAGNAGVYARWSARVVENLDPGVAPPTTLALFDEETPLTSASFAVLEGDADGNLTQVSGGTTDEQGLASVVLPEGRYAIRSGNLQSSLDVSHDELGGQMLVVLAPAESE